MSQQSLLIRVTAILDREGVAYMLTGSTASSIHGEPRSTHDIDLVVSLQSGAIEGLLAGFPEPDFYLSEDAIRNALRQRTMFNLIDVTTGDKVGFWMLTDEPFDQSRFGRRRCREGTGALVSQRRAAELTYARTCRRSRISASTVSANSSTDMDACCSMP